MGCMSFRQTSLGIPGVIVSISAGKPVRRRIAFRRSPSGARTMTDFRIKPDQALVAKMVAGDAAAFAALESRMQDRIWTACLVAMGRKDRLAREGFREVWSSLLTTSFRRCGPWSGKEPFEIFLTVIVRELLLEWSVRLLRQDSPLATDIFVGLFGRVIRNLVVRSRANSSDRDEAFQDAFQEVLAQLFANDCARLKAYRGPGSFEGHVRKIVIRLLIDDLRVDIGRRRVPAAIEKLSFLDQSVFRAIEWDGIPADADRLLAATSKNHRLATRADIEAAIKRVQAAAPDYIVRPKPISIDAPVTPSGDTTDDTTIGDNLSAGDKGNPFADLSGKESEKQMQAAAAAMKRGIDVLESDEDRIYARLFLDGVDKPREMAKIMGVPVKRINVVKERVHRRLEAFLGKNPDVSAWLAGNSEGE
jgi:DNA-directed RNA polymerase specialized sigma24 family protein